MSGFNDGQEVVISIDPEVGVHTDLHAPVDPRTWWGMVG